MKSVLYAGAVISVFPTMMKPGMFCTAYAETAVILTGVIFTAILIMVVEAAGKAAQGFAGIKFSGS